MNIFYLAVKTGFYYFFRVVYGHRVYGHNRLPPGRAIIAPNHVSFFDPPLVGGSMKGELVYLARKSLFDKPLFGYLLRWLNSYPVSGSAQDISSFKLLGKLLTEEKKVLVFPEGVRSWDGQLSDFQSGIGMLALRNCSPVVPVYIHGTYEIWNRNEKRPKWHGKTACVFGTPIYPEAFQEFPKKEGQEALAFQVKASILNLQNWYLEGCRGSPP